MRTIINKPFLLLIFFLFNMHCYGENSINVFKDINSDQSCLKLNISINNVIVQTIDYSYSKDTIENAIFVEDEYELVDINFDGFEDILIYLGSFGNQGVVYKDCYTWNNDKKLFENYILFKNIPNPQIDVTEKCIYGNIRNNSNHYEYALYSWNGKDLVCNFKIHKLYNAMQLADLYKIEIPEDRDSGDYMLEYFNIDRTFYDSVFYVKINNKESLKKTNPSTEIFNDLPDGLKNLLKE